MKGRVSDGRSRRCAAAAHAAGKSVPFRVTS
jgi:hypothetical protein